MKHAAHAGSAGGDDHSGDVIVGFASVHDDGAIQLRGEPYLRLERSALCVARRMVVVVIKTAFTDRHGAVLDVAPNCFEVSVGVEGGSIVGMNAGGMID